jgi:N-acetylmuramic acid 6-phosphate (MurNAc-6-P) etherase
LVSFASSNCQVHQRHLTVQLNTTADTKDKEAQQLLVHSSTSIKQMLVMNLWNKKIKDKPPKGGFSS